MKEVLTRIEKDSLGEIKLPKNALYGAQTQRAIENFQISSLKMPAPFIQALGLLKWAAAQANTELNLLDPKIGKAIEQAALAVADNQYDSSFPVDVFQTGSGTSTNMNANEVIAQLACESLQENVHPNNHVNMSQSSNDIIPSALSLASALLAHNALIPGLKTLCSSLKIRAKEFEHTPKTGRTHLMDALPLTLGQELSGWQAQIQQAIERIELTLLDVFHLAIGATAVGTGVNAPEAFAEIMVDKLNAKTKLPFQTSRNRFASISNIDSIVSLSGELKTLSCSLMKIANDLRWMNSGPLSGLNEITLPAIQPGSSMMPGKINPVIPEAVCMVCAKVIGNDTTLTLAGQSGQFQLNVMLPVSAYTILESLSLLANATLALAKGPILGFKANLNTLSENLAKNPILITALNPLIGYEKGAEIAQKAYAENRPILEVAKEMTTLPEAKLKALLSPLNLC